MCPAMARFIVKSCTLSTAILPPVTSECGPSLSHSLLVSKVVTTLKHRSLQELYSRYRALCRRTPPSISLTHVLARFTSGVGSPTVRPRHQLQLLDASA